jgi:hypothetical protein
MEATGAYAVKIHHGKIPGILPFRRRKIKIEIRKVTCLSIHSSALETPTRLMLGLLKSVNGLLLKHQV